MEKKNCDNGSLRTTKLAKEKYSITYTSIQVFSKDKVVGCCLRTTKLKLKVLIKDLIEELIKQSIAFNHYKQESLKIFKIQIAAKLLVKEQSS